MGKYLREKCLLEHYLNNSFNYLVKSISIPKLLLKVIQVQTKIFRGTLEHYWVNQFMPTQVVPKCIETSFWTFLYSNIHWKHLTNDDQTLT